MNKHMILRTENGYAFDGLNVSGLAPRESQVLLLRAAGMSISACSETLNCGTQAIKSRMNSLFYKLRADNTPELIAKAFKNGYLRVLMVMMAMHIGISAPMMDSQKDMVARTGRARSRVTQRYSRVMRSGGLLWMPDTNELV